MFDRSNRAAGPLNVEITLADGRQLKGKLVVPQGRSLPEVLNAPANFIELDMAEFQRTFVSKCSIQTVTTLDAAAEHTIAPRQPANVSSPAAANQTATTSIAQ